MRPEALAALLERPELDEVKVLEALVSALPSGEATPELFGKLHAAAADGERAANLSFAYDRLARDARVKLLPRPKQAEFFLAAAKFFGETFGDVEAAAAFGERAYHAAPEDADVFDRLETILASLQLGTKLGRLYADKASRAPEPREKLRFLRAAVDLYEFDGSKEDLAPLLRSVVDLDAEDTDSLRKLEPIYTAMRRWKELSDVLEQVLSRAPGSADAASDEVRLKLVGLYRGELRDPSKAALHVEALLSRDPVSPAALQAAEALIDHRTVAPRIAPLLSGLYERLGRSEDEASTLSLELKFARPPRLAEVHRRLAVLRKDVLGDPAGALELLEPLMARDPSDDDLRRRYIDVSTTFHRELEAAKLLSRALSAVKDGEVRVRVALDIAELFATQGDEKRARATLEPLLEEAEDGARLVIARKLTELHSDASDPKGLATALRHVVSLEPELVSRVGAGKRLVELAEKAHLPAKLAIAGYRALIGSPRTDEALDRLEALYAATADDVGSLEVLELRAARTKDPATAKQIALRSLELRVARTKDRAQAISFVNEFLLAHGPERGALERLAKLCEQQRDPRGLSAALEALLGVVDEGERAAIFARLARTRLTDLRDEPGALSALESALSLDPKEPTARRLAERLLGEGGHRKEIAGLLGRVYRAEGNHAGTLRVLRAEGELSTEPRAALSALEEAHHLGATVLRDPRACLEIAGRALSLSIGQGGGLGEWLSRLRAAAEETGDAPKAAELLVFALGDGPIDSPDLAEIAREAAEALVRASDVQRAVEIYRRILSFDPASQETLARVDEVLAVQGVPEERLSLHRAALERAEDGERRRDLLRAIARIQHRDMGDVAGARQTLETLVREFPGDLSAHEGLVEVHRVTGAREELLGELTRALSFLRGAQRHGVLLTLAHEHADRGEAAQALAAYRELIDADELPVDELPRVSALAEAAGDLSTLAAVLERALSRTADDAQQAEIFEKLGEVRARMMGDETFAVAAFRKATSLLAGVPGSEAHLERLHSKILAAAPGDAEAARYLFDQAAQAGEWSRLPALFGRLLGNDASGAPLAALGALTARAIEARALDEVASMIESALARGPADDDQARELRAERARALSFHPARRADALRAFRELTERHGVPGEPGALARLLETAAPSEASDVRWLLEDRARRSADRVLVLLDWARVEEERFGEPASAADILRRALAEGLSTEDRADIEARLAALLVERLEEPREGLTLVRSVLGRAPGHPEALRVARALLARNDTREGAADLFVELSRSAPGSLGPDALRSLLDQTRGAGLDDARASWYSLLVEAHSEDPTRALSIAIEAAEELPARDELWDAAERFARRARSADALGASYRKILSRPLDAELAERIGKRCVELHEEWFDDPATVLSLLEQVIQLSPRARWALDRVKLLYNAEGRWGELFALYDHAIQGARSDAEREDLLDEAALAAKDLALDLPRAIFYLERLLALRPEARVEAMLERLYERTGRSRELLSLLERRVAEASGAEAEKLRLRLAGLEIDVGEVDSAFLRIEQSLASAPDDPRAYELLESLLLLPQKPAAPPPSGTGARRPRKGKAKGKSGTEGRNVRQEAALLLERRYRGSGDLVGISRVLEASLADTRDPGERLRRLEELVTICLEKTDDAERAFSHLTTLVELEPSSPLHRQRRAVVAMRLAADERRPPAERCELLEIVAAHGPDGESRRAATVTLAELSEGELGDGERAVRAYRQWLEEAPEDAEVLGRLIRVLSGERRFPELCEALFLRAALVPETSREDLVRAARIQSDELSDARAAIATWRRIRAEHGAREDTFEALAMLLSVDGRWDELAQLYEEAAARAEPGLATELYRRLGDLHRDRTRNAILALEAYVRAGDFGRVQDLGNHLSEPAELLRVASKLLDLCEGPAKQETIPSGMVDALEWAALTLVRGHREAGAHDAVVEVLLRAGHLPFGADKQRRMRRDAAFVVADKLLDPGRATAILGELFAEESTDEVATQSVSRYARLLDESGRHAELAALWEKLARARAEAADRAGAAALFGLSADVWETRLSEPDRAIAAHRNGAALGGEASLEALARIYTERRNHRAAAATLEWLVAQSTREELGPRVLRLSDAYLASGDWERACARLEGAATSAMDASSVRQRLIQLYRAHSVWGPLCQLLVLQADGATDDRTRLGLLREAATIHVEQRGDAASAVPLLQRATELDPEDPALPLALADVLRTSGRYEEALVVLRARVDSYGHRRPKDRAVVHLYLARVALAAGRRAEALAELDVGAKIDPAHPGILYELGRLALSEGQLTRAERTYRALLLVLRKPDGQAAHAPSRAEIYLDLSEIAAAQGEPERATDLVESAFDAALESPRDAECLERALRKVGRHDLLTRAVENRLSSASEAAAAARALSDLVILHSEHLGGGSDITGRVQMQASRIHRELDSGSSDEAAWAALSKVYEWLGDRGLEARALERRVGVLLEGVSGDLSPLLRLAELKLADPAGRKEGLALSERALERGADPDRIWSLVRCEDEEGLTDPGTLKLLERISRESGRDEALAEVMTLRAEASALPEGALREAVDLARGLGLRALVVRLLEGALRHSVAAYPDEASAWVRETLARLLIEDGSTPRALDLLEEASALLPAGGGRALALEVARRATEEPPDHPRAARLYARLLEKDPSDRAAWEPLLQVHRKSGDRRRLIALIEATAPLVESPPDRARLRLEEATLMLEDPAEEEHAIGLLSTIVSETPSFLDAVKLLGRLLSEKGRFDELGKLLESELDQARSTGDPDLVEASAIELGALLERQGHAERALLTYRGVLDWNPRSRPVLRALVRLEEASACPAHQIGDTLEKLVPLEEGEAVASMARRLVELRMSDGDAAGADRALELACASNPHDAAFRERLLARRLELLDWAGAGDVLRRAARVEQKDKALFLRAVEAYERGGDLDAAVAVLGEAISQSDEDPELYAERARLLRERGKVEEALADLEAAQARGGARAAELVRALEAALKDAEGEARLRHTLRLASLLEELGETTRAREELGRLVKVMPKERDALRRLASLASAEARWDESAATYRRLIPLEDGPAMVEAALNLADACEHVGKLADARSGLERALEGAPGSAPIRARLIQVYETTGAYRELAELLLEEARAEPDVAARTATLLSVAELYLEKNGDPAATLRVLSEVRRLAPESVPGAVLCARAEATLGHRDLALAALEGVVSAYRGRRARELSTAHREISSLHVEAGDLPKALEALSRAFDLDMRNGDLAMQLGHLALDLNDAETAQKAFRSVTMMKLRQAPSNEGASAESKAVSYYHLGRIAQDQGDLRKARLMVTKALTENPSHSEAQALLTELKGA